VSKNKVKIWAVYSEEETPIGMVLAKTAGGAKKRYEERTGYSRHLIHVEKVEFRKNCFLFTHLT
jgi:hypothetical protein